MELMVADPLKFIESFDMRRELRDLLGEICSDPPRW